MRRVKRCPFCGGKAKMGSRYDSDDNHPDGNQHYAECSDCGAKGEEYYAVDINHIHLTPRQRVAQEANYNNAVNLAVRSWNKRTTPALKLEKQ